MPKATTPGEVTRRLAEMRSVADLDERAGQPVGEALRCAVRAVEAALSTGLILNAENAAGADETKRTAMCEGAALHMTQVRQAVAEAMTGRAEAGGGSCG